ncbi:MAG TPA: Gfo/Idh/MocA family oxidoreductase [Bryobacteraceae bacterium]|nr:Gfo/Idh/MocA family oxidoreductase [Bryobacteraceae bacterium]
MSELNRRHFIAASGLAAAGTLLGADDPVGTGFIGTGNRGSYLLQTVVKEQPGAKVVAVCDLKHDRLDKAATLAARDAPATFTDYRRLLDRKDVNAVFIASPCDLHVEMAIAALKAGKHVYCEKPAGITPQSIADLVKVAKASKTVFQAGQQMRSNARFAKVAEKLREGVAGKLFMVKAQRHAGDDLDHEGSSAEWFFNAARSGDVIVEMAVHNLDLCNWMLDSRPERAAGFGGTLLWKNDPPGRTNMDGYTLSYDYANGAKLSFTQVFFHPDAMPNGGQYVHIYGTEGAVDLMNGTFYPRVRGAKPVVIAPRQPEPAVEPHIAAFYQAIRGERKPAADITVAATAALTAILGREAIYQKRVTTWKEMGVEI